VKKERIAQMISFGRGGIGRRREEAQDSKEGKSRRGGEEGTMVASLGGVKDFCHTPGLNRGKLSPLRLGGCIDIEERVSLRCVVVPIRGKTYRHFYWARQGERSSG